MMLRLVWNVTVVLNIVSVHVNNDCNQPDTTILSYYCTYIYNPHKVTTAKNHYIYINNYINNGSNISLS